MTLRRFARTAIRYGLVPSDIAPDSTFTPVPDLEYLAAYLAHMRATWHAPRWYGISARNRERAARAWSRLLSK